MSFPYFRLAQRCCRLLSSVSRQYPQLMTRNLHTSCQRNPNSLHKLHREWIVLRKRVLNATRSFLRGEKYFFSTSTTLKAASGKPNQMPGGKSNRTLVLWLLGLLVIFVMISQDGPITWDDFVYGYLKEGKVSKLLVSRKKRFGDMVVFVDVVLQEQSYTMKRIYFTVDSIDRFEKDVEQIQNQLGIPPVKIEYHGMGTTGTDWKETFGTTGVVLLLSSLIIYRIFKKWGTFKGFPGDLLSGMFVKSPATLVTKNTGVTFKDVAGCEEAKIEIMEFVNFLKNPKGYEELGAKVPKGALLNGPPGTGKTLLAKATAGEAGVPFITASGSEFLELFVGVGIKRIRNMFQMAKENAPCILFIDEIDALAMSRGDNSKPSEVQVERENTLNQLLVEMDGFESQRGVIVLAATNRIHVLDKALLRPGRFDRQIYVSSPDIKGRASIFKVYLNKLKVDFDIEVVARKMASLTPGLSGADIMNICNEAALVAVRNKKTHIEMSHFELALERIVAGMEKKALVLQPAEKQKIAYHEAGRAVAGWFLEYAKPLLKISIVPRGDRIGHAMYLPREQFLYTKEELMDLMCMDLGGCIAHEIFFGNMTTRSQKDLRAVTKLAYKQVANFGMSEKVGNLSYDKAGPEDLSIEKPYSENLAQLIDTEVNKVIQEAYTRTRDLLTKHMVEVEKVAAALLEKEKLDKDGLVKLLGPRPFKETLTYEDIVAGTGSLDEDTEIPESLKNWNRNQTDDKES